MKVKWSALAKKQFREILLFYQKRNGTPYYGNRLKSQVRKVLTFIKVHPSFGEYLNHEKRRRICIGNFELLYVIKDTHVEIESFRDGRREQT